jgi:hypothetical protein
MALPPSATELMHQPSISLSAAHDRVVCVLAQLHGLRYCPMLSNLGLLLLRHLSESATFSVLEALLKDNREEWFQKTWEDEVAFVNTFQVRCPARADVPPCAARPPLPALRRDAGCVGEPALEARGAPGVAGRRHLQLLRQLVPVLLRRVDHERGEPQRAPTLRCTASRCPCRCGWRRRRTCARLTLRLRLTTRHRTDAGVQDTFKIVDCYLSEGPKVLIRFGIAFLKLCSKELMKAMSDNDVEDTLRDFVSMRGFPGKYSFEALSNAAFSVRNFSRKTVYQLYEKHRSLMGGLAGQDEDMMATAYRCVCARLLLSALRVSGSRLRCAPQCTASVAA